MSCNLHQTLFYLPVICFLQFASSVIFIFQSSVSCTRRYFYLPVICFLQFASSVIFIFQSSVSCNLHPALFLSSSHLFLAICIRRYFYFSVIIFLQFACGVIFLVVIFLQLASNAMFIYQLSFSFNLLHNLFINLSVVIFLQISSEVIFIAVACNLHHKLILSFSCHFLAMSIKSCIYISVVSRSIILIAKENTPAMMQLLGVGYGVGALLVPLFANPFLAALEYSPNTDAHSIGQVKVIKESRVHYAFVVIGISSALLSLVFVYFHFLVRGSDSGTDNKTDNKTPVSVLEMINPATYANGSFWFGTYVLVTLSIFYFSLVGGMEIYSHFIRSFSVDVFKFSKTEASYLNMSFWLTVALSKVFMSLASAYISVRKLFKIQVLLHVLSTIVLNMYGSQTSSLLWLCTIIEAFFVSPLYPGAIAYSNSLIDVKGMCLTVIIFAANVGDIIFIWTGGKFYDSLGPHIIFIGVQIGGIMHFICLILFKVIERHKNRIMDYSINK